MHLKQLFHVDIVQKRLLARVTQVEDTVSTVSSTSSGYGSQQRESGEFKS